MVHESAGQTTEFDPKIRLHQYRLIEHVVEACKVPAIPTTVDLQDDERTFSADKFESLEWSEIARTLFSDVPITTTKIPRPTDQTTQSFREFARRLDSTDLQLEDLDEACRRLAIPDKRRLHIPGMQVTQRLRPWQVLGVRHILKVLEAGARGDIIADVPGLGKTIIILAFFQIVST